MLKIKISACLAILVFLLGCPTKNASGKKADTVLGVTLSAEGLGDYISACGTACIFLGHGCKSADEALGMVGKPVAILCSDQAPIYTKLDRVSCDTDNFPSALTAQLTSVPSRQKKPCVVAPANLPPTKQMTKTEQYSAPKALLDKLVKRAAVTITKKQMLNWTYLGFLDETSKDGITDDAKTLSILQKGLSKAKARLYDFKGRKGERLLELTLSTSGYMPPPHGGPTSIVVVVLTDDEGNVQRLLTGGPSESSRIFGIYDFDQDGLDDVFINAWGADGQKGWNGELLLYLSKRKKIISLFAFFSAA